MIEAFRRVVFGNRAWFAPLISFLLHVGIHLPFLITSELAEPDAGRLIFDGLVLADQGPGVLTDYRIRSSPAYLVGIAWLLNSGIVSLAELPPLLTWLSLISGGITVSLVVVLVRRWLHSKEAMVVSWLLIEASPVFWQSSISGFPTMVSVALFTASLALLDAYFCATSPRQGIAFAGLAIPTYLLATLIKIDALALAPGLLGLMIFRSPQKAWIRTGLAILLASGAAFIIGSYTAQYYEAVQPKENFWQSWDARWPMTLSTLFSTTSFGRYLCGAGLLMPLASLAALFAMYRHSDSSRRLAIFLLLWVLPATIFWMSRSGGARHFLTVYIPLAIAASWWVSWRPHSLRLWGQIACLLIVDYFIWPPSSDTLRPSGRLLASSVAYQQEAKDRHEVARHVASLLKKGTVLVHSLGEHTPYVIYEASLLSQDQYAKRIKPFQPLPNIELARGLQITLPNRKSVVLGYAYSPPTEAALQALAVAGIRVIDNIQDLDSPEVPR